MRICVDADVKQIDGALQVTFSIPDATVVRVLNYHKKKQSAYILISKEKADPKEAIKAIKDKFYNDIAAWKEKNPGKYPSGFYKVFYEHWTMATQDGTAIRLQDKEKAKYWKLGARLNTAWAGGYHTLEQKQVWWEQDKEKNH